MSPAGPRARAQKRSQNPQFSFPLGLPLILSFLICFQEGLGLNQFSVAIYLTPLLKIVFISNTAQQSRIYPYSIWEYFLETLVAW